MAPAFARVSKDDLTLWLAGPMSSAARPMPDGRRPEPGGWNRFVVTIEELVSHVTEMKKAGVSFRNDIVVALAASRSCWRIRMAILSSYSSLRDSYNTIREGLISVTRRRVRSLRYLLPFLWQTFKVIRQTERSPQFLGGRVLCEARNAFWTVTASVCVESVPALPAPSHPVSATTFCPAFQLPPAA